MEVRDRVDDQPRDAAAKVDDLGVSAKRCVPGDPTRPEPTRDTSHE
jgi:hypothetical protein